jgi:hypothetical protein
MARDNARCLYYHFDFSIPCRRRLDKPARGERSLTKILHVYLTYRSRNTIERDRWYYAKICAPSKYHNITNSEGNVPRANKASRLVSQERELNDLNDYDKRRDITIAKYSCVFITSRIITSRIIVTVTKTLKRLSISHLSSLVRLIILR